MEIKLSEEQICVLKILNNHPPGTWLLTGQIGRQMPVKFYGIRQGREVINISIQESRKIYVSNKMGVVLGIMARKGLLIRKLSKLKKPNKMAQGMNSEWCLGPMSDLLKEQGII